MPFHYIFSPITNVVESVIDNIRDQVIPIPGSVVYCDLMYGYMEHSGVYAGDNMIIQLSNSGVIEAVTPDIFIKGTTANNISVSCKGLEPVGSSAVASRALDKLGEIEDYNFLFNNCHQFTAGCLTGNFNEKINYLTQVKNKSRMILNSNTWRFWSIDLDD